LDFDTLFIPADALTVRRLAPALAFWGIQPRTIPGDGSRIQLVGHAGWNNPVVVDKGEHLTDNAVFADVFAPDDPDAQDFARRFYLRLERRPTAFHAEAWDATQLLLEALAAARAGPQPITREGVRDAFLTPRVLVGATGQVEVVAGGRIRPRAHLMTIDGDEIRRRYSEDEERARRTTTIPAERAP
jgi:ABC-type branched-subunit amino acid transport system substrate-binding protein